MHSDLLGDMVVLKAIEFREGEQSGYESDLIGDPAEDRSRCWERWVHGKIYQEIGSKLFSIPDVRKQIMQAAQD